MDDKKYLDYEYLYKQPFTITNIGSGVCIIVINQTTKINGVPTDSLYNYNVFDSNNVSVDPLIEFKHKIKFGITDVYIKLEPKESLTICAKNDSVFKLNDSYVHVINNINVDDSITYDHSIELSGNINSLLTSNFTNENIRLDPGCFQGLFSENSALKHTDKLVLPSKYLSYRCYQDMFNGCINLLTPPKILPANKIPTCAYKNMFRNCQNLIYIPDILATQFNADCCTAMFARCLKLSDISNFPKDFDYICMCAFYDMFTACCNLKIFPKYFKIKNKVESNAFTCLFDRNLILGRDSHNIDVYFDENKAEPAAFDLTGDNSNSITSSAFSITSSAFRNNYSFRIQRLKFIPISNSPLSVFRKYYFGFKLDNSDSECSESVLEKQ